MASLNKVILIGNVGNDPEVRSTANGNVVTSVSLATSETWKDKSTGSQKKETEWHSLVFFGKVGEISGRYLKKGSKCYVEGKKKTREWEDKTGIKRYRTDIVVDKLVLLSSKDETHTNSFGGFSDVPF